MKSNENRCIGQHIRSFGNFNYSKTIGVFANSDEFSENVVEYSHSAGFESYRKGLSNYYKDLGINVSYEDLMITTGGSEALLFALNSCLDSGDEIIIPEPFYANYNGFSISAGVKVKMVMKIAKTRRKDVVVLHYLCVVANAMRVWQICWLGLRC